MSGLKIVTLVPVLIFLAVNEFAVMCILPFLGIPDGPLTYLVDAVLLAVLSAPILYAWAGKMPSYTRRHMMSDSGVREMQTLEELERQAIKKALEIAHGDRTRAAQTLGVSRATIYRRVKKLGLENAVRA